MLKPEKALQRAPILIFLCLGVMLASMLVESKTDRNRTVVINARINNIPVKTYQHVELGENTFVTGIEGEVYWKPKSFKEAFLIRSIVNTRSALGLFDILYLFIVNCIFFWMVYNIKIDDFFNKKVLMGTYIIFVMLVGYGFMGIIRHSLSDHLLKEITNGQFGAPYLGNSSLLPYVMVMFIFFQTIPIFIRRAQKIQQEQKYTI